MNYKTLLLLFLFLYTNSVTSQNTGTATPLKKILDNLSIEYQVTFSYADSDIENLSFVNWTQKTSLKKNLRVIKGILPISIKKINKYAYALSIRTRNNKYCGKIIQDNAEPLQNASIQWGEIVTKSDSNGDFRIYKRRISDKINIGLNGYQSIELNYNSINQQCEDIILSKGSSNLALDEVILRNYITKGISKNRQGYININYDEFGILPGLIESDVLLTAQALPSITSVNERVSELNIRGGTNDQNLLLWDGIKMYQSGHFFGLISAFNPETTNRAKIYTNGTPAKYTDGISGTIAMETDNTIAKQLKGTVGVNLLNGNVALDIPVSSQSSLQVAGRYSINGLYMTPTFNSYFEQAFRDTEVFGGFDTSEISDQLFNFFDGSLRYVSKIGEKTFLKINGIAISNELNFTENGIFEEKESVRVNSVNQRNLATGILLNHKWNENLIFNSQFYITNYNLNSDNSSFNTSQRLVQENDVLESSYSLDSKYTLNSNVNITAGYQFKETSITNFADVTNPNFTSNIKEVIRNNGFYMEGDLRLLHNKARLMAGIRANTYGKLDTLTIEPRLIFNYKLFNGFTAELKGEIKNQVTSQVINLQNDFIGVDNRRWILSNGSTIPILSSRQFSGGLFYKKRDLLISSEFFFKNINGITTQSQGFLNQLQLINATGSYEIKGLEILVSKGLGNINSSVSYSYSDNNYEWDFLPDNVVTEFPNNTDIRHNLIGIFDYNYKGFKLATSLNWRFGKPFTPFNNQEPILNNEINFGIPNSERIDNYFRVDVSATYDFKMSNTSKGFIGLSIWNLTNETNELERTFLVSDNEVATVRRRALERTPNLSFKVSF